MRRGPARDPCGRAHADVIVLGGDPLEDIGLLAEGPEYPEFIGFETETVHFGIQKPSPATTRQACSPGRSASPDIDAAMERCRSAGIGFELEHNNPGPGWAYRRLLIRTPSGYRLALEGPNE